jgi:hypothetical protein
MRRVVASLCLAWSALVLAAPATPPRPLGTKDEARANKVLLRASKVGYARLGRLLGEQAQVKAKLGRLLYSDGSGVPFWSDTLAVYSTWSDREKAIAGQKDPVAARRSVAYYERTIADIDATLAELPGVVASQTRLGPLRQNQALRDHGALRQRMRAVRDDTLIEAAAPVEDARARIHQIEAHVIGKLDERYATLHTKVKAKLAELPPEQLYQQALTLVHQIDGMAHDKGIAKEEVARGSSSSGFSSDSSSESRSVSVGLFSASGSRSSSSSHAEGWSQSKFSSDQLLLHAASYQVRTRNVAVGWEDTKALTPVEARMLAGMVLDLHDVTHALQKKDPGRAATLSSWLEHSTIDFQIPQTGYNGKREHATVTLQLGHAPRDVQRLQKVGIVGDRLVQKLEAELREPLGEHLEGGGIWSL